jgi:tRNA uridine 5-carbamoylmethylation protein Kti12
MNSVPTCYLLIGPPCSGKSTFREAHLAKTDRHTVIISSDDYFERFAAAEGITYSAAFARLDFKSITKAMSQEISDAITANHDFMVDQTNMSIKSRNKVLARLPRHYRRVGVLFNVPRDVLDTRLEKRARETGKYIPKETVDEMIARYQEPLSTEFHEIIHV